MLKWIKSKFSNKTPAPGYAQNYTQTWRELQLAADELRFMEDDELILSVTLLTQRYQSEDVMEIVDNFDGVLTKEQRQTLENFYTFLSTELGLSAD